jgi:signal peptidase II
MFPLSRFATLTTLSLKGRGKIRILPSPLEGEGGAARAGRGPVIKWFALSLVVFILDQLSKIAILKHFTALKVCAYNQPRLALCDDALMPFFNLTMLWNPGVSMGLFQANSALAKNALTALTAAIALFVAWAITREKDRVQQFAFALVLGGAIGNILDRVRFGAVVDFIRFHLEPVGVNWSFYVFNVADAAISIGVALLVFRAFFPGTTPSTKEEPKEI